MAAQRLAGKVCIVTGASSGLGRAIALAYAREGATLVCADLQPTARAEISSEVAVDTDELIRRGNGRAIFVKTDVSKSEDFEQLVATAAKGYGRVDVLVNNAGISIEAGRPPARLHETPLETWDTTMAVNTRSIFLGCKYAIAQMLKQTELPSDDRGWIINISSIYGLVGGRHNCSYAASKGAVTSLTRSVAMDYADVGIHCNAINPGYTETAIFKNTVSHLDDIDSIRSKHPLHGTGEPKDIAGAAIFLASAEARWITGVNLAVDGGFTAQSEPRRDLVRDQDSSLQEHEKKAITKKPMRRSYLGCETCRSRKLKCDETKPECGPCQKASRPCRYSDRSIFRTAEPQSFLGRSHERSRRHNTQSSAEEVLFADDHVWVDVPNNLKFINILDPYDDVPESPRNDEPEAQDLAFFDESNDATDGGDVACEVAPNATSNVAHTFDPVQLPEGNQRVDDAIVELQLRQYFREGPAQWIDLFDTSAYFASKVPVMATTRPLLKMAVSALAAKHLHRSEKYGAKNKATIPSKSRLLELSNNVDWNYEAATYYQRAIGHLKAATQEQGFGHEHSMDANETEVIFASVTMLSFYELMDAPSIAWRAHLHALPLFSTMPGLYSPFNGLYNLKRPIFWNLARQDVLCAFISETQTRLSPEDVYLWQNAGLFRKNTISQPLESPGSAVPDTTADIEEGIRSNELVWILGKIINFLTSGDALNPEDYALPPERRLRLGVTQEELLERWGILNGELQRWYDSLPQTFTAVARTRNAHGAAGPGTLFEQVWYEVPMCAATMQSYHMARILLLVNQPQESTAVRSTVSARQKAYRRAQEEAARHAREICGISSANPLDAVRIHSVQALFVAGQTLHEPQEQQAVISLLSGIESDLGWATGYHVSKLINEWTGG
ncbi:putative oxidoreductase [Tolypocladium ophioglossoides CBS 100239]|uniref:Putative oxidoreductase n=1 Tax=Tolypocladium ophioglossoides (strain CBS 100239) TaxID=1163406 RepID=A0A0L0MXB5_TOLOC|nr:putative oxidoreductase [Tolypocladium ophioglossoides CBS 100239]